MQAQTTFEIFKQGCVNKFQSIYLFLNNAATSSQSPDKHGKQNRDTIEIEKHALVKLLHPVCKAKSLLFKGGKKHYCDNPVFHYVQY